MSPTPAPDPNDLTTLTIPDSVTYLGDWAFQWNDLTSVTLGKGLTNIPDGTFYFSHLTTIDIPSNITSIGSDAFVLNNFASLTIPDSVTSIGDSAFSVISSLTSLSLGNGLTSIGALAFAGTGLTSVSIPASVTDIGDRAFDTNAGMTSVVFQGAAPMTFTPRTGALPSLGDVDAIVYYSSAHAADFTPSPWQGYVSAPGLTLDFDLGGHGSAIADITVIPSSAAPANLAPPATPAATGYVFQGWFTAATGGTAFDFTAPLRTDTTAFARWAPDPALAATGVDSLPLLIAGGSLLVVGIIVLLALKLRRRSTTSDSAGQ